MVQENIGILSGTWAPFPQVIFLWGCYCFPNKRDTLLGIHSDYIIVMTPSAAQITEELKPPLTWVNDLCVFVFLIYLISSSSSPNCVMYLERGDRGGIKAIAGYIRKQDLAITHKRVPVDMPGTAQTLYLRYIWQQNHVGKFNKQR